MPYDFEAYEKTSEQIYKIFLKFAETVEAVSVDEAYLEMTGIVLPRQFQGTREQELLMSCYL